MADRGIVFVGLLWAARMAALLPGCSSFHASPPVRRDEPPIARRPVLVGEPWQIAGDPDLGELTDPRQQPVDFAIWQAADGTWQLWSCIRGTKCGGMTRLFYRWEGRDLTDPDWMPTGIARRAEVSRGETPGGLQAPFVFIDQDLSEKRVRPVFYMVYGDWINIRMVRSRDGKTFDPFLLSSDERGLFSEGPQANTRDPMMMKSSGKWYCYYTAHPGKKGAVYCRTSENRLTWSQPTIVARGGTAGTGPGSAECPFVVQLDGYYYLFRTQRYGRNAQTRVYRSHDPLDFGVDSDEYLIAELPVAAPEIIYHDGQWYLACLLPSLKGIEMHRLAWEPAVPATQPLRNPAEN